MENRIITSEIFLRFRQYLLEEEHAEGTICKYLRDMKGFSEWLAGIEVSREKVIQWKEYLIQRGYAPITINSMLAATNTFFKFMGWYDCTVKYLRIQRRLFRDQSKELTQTEYRKLINAALSSEQIRLAMLLETIGSTGIRVSEVKYITVEAVQKGSTSVTLKGKIRVILLPSKLRRKLIKYAKRNKILSGEIFLTRNGRGLTRKQIWAEMKNLCKKAEVEPSKVFPHNLRHLFASTFYRASRNIVQLADILGHSSVETTRIYLVSTGVEHIRQLDRLGLVL